MQQPVFAKNAVIISFLIVVVADSTIYKRNANTYFEKAECKVTNVLIFPIQK